ncbi:MAG TPA: hypothetical protein VME46_21450 [Acidimicrobiales bacterium]|nr:hypothetical protein [Acidimicrobiales bacterium]
MRRPLGVVVVLVAAWLGWAPLGAAAGVVVTEYQGVACPTATSCVAVGVNEAGHLVVTLVGAAGRPGETSVSPSAMYPSGAPACPSVATCFVGGTNAGNDGTVTPVTMSSGHLGRPQAQDTTIGEYRGMACASATTCYAAGVSKGDVSGDAEYSVVTHGRPGPAVAIPGTGPSSGMQAACPPSASSCLVVGNYGTGGFIAVVSGSKVTALKSITAYAYSVACPTLSQCVIVGSQSLDSGPRFVTFDPVTGALGPLMAVHGATGTFDSVACSSAQSCVIVGAGQTGGEWLTFASDRPGPVHATAALLYGVGCGKGGACYAVGSEKAMGVVLRLP